MTLDAKCSNTSGVTMTSRLSSIFKRFLFIPYYLSYWFYLWRN